jgi:FlaG/FlaF family flagellin (archaellin)
VQLTQDATLQRDYRGFSGAAGTISEAVLIITDLAGIVHSYYQDLRAEVTSLPKYGDLSYTAPRTPSPYGNWRENFEVTAEGKLVPKLGGERPLGYCYGPDSYFNASTQDADNVYQQCPDNFGVAPLLSTLRVLGDTPETAYLRNERVVVYKPRQGYLGPDYFTYIVHDGQNIQTHEVQGSAQGSQNEVTVHVRKCRPFTDKIKRGLDAKLSPSFAADGSHLLCQCAQTEISQINNRTVCDAARAVVCSSSANNDTVNSWDHFKAMCLTCTDPRRGLLSGECQTQTIRAVSLLTSRGLCRATKGPTATPFMDCTAETVTEPGREATNYLSSKPPLLTGAFQKLMNSFGAYGWYHTPLLT